MNEYEFLGKKYTIEKQVGESFDYEELKEKITDYFESYDYILCDIAYHKVRLKGFYDQNNKKANKINSIKGLDNYIKEYCAYGCNYFLLKKVQ